jgi:hypothetical protein
MSVGFLTKGTSMNHQNSMPPRISPPKFIPPPPAQRETLVYGARECPFTTVTFILTQENGDSAHNILMIGIDEHNGEDKSRLMIRGQFEAQEIPSQLRWLADAIAQQVEDRPPFVAGEYVTYEKLRGGGK